MIRLPFRSNATLCIDLGAASTRILCLPDGGMSEQPSLLALRSDETGGHRQVVAMGADADCLLRQGATDLKSSWPLRDGVMANFSLAEMLLGRLLGELPVKVGGWRRPQALLAAPVGASADEREARLELARVCGLTPIDVVEAPLAARLGFGLGDADEQPLMLVDIGAGGCEVALLMHGEVLAHRRSLVGGNVMDEAIMAYLLRTYGVTIDAARAEGLKLRLGSALPAADLGRTWATGRRQGRECRFSLDANALLEALRVPVVAIHDEIDALLMTLSDPQLAGIAERAIVLVGAAAQLPDLDRYLAQRFGLPVILAQQPATAVIRGLSLG